MGGRAIANGKAPVHNKQAKSKKGDLDENDIENHNKQKQAEKDKQAYLASMNKGGAKKKK